MVVRLPVPLPPVVRDLVPGVVSGPDRDPRGLRILLTGASGTFGRATAAALADRGSTVVGIDVAPRGDEQFSVHHCDVADEVSVMAAVTDAVDELGGVDVLVNNAGVGGPAPAELTPDAQVYRQLEINLLGGWRVTAAALPALVSCQGRVVVVASRAAVFPLPLAGAYGASKRAQVAWADALRLELAPDVGVTTVYPSKVASPIHDSTTQAGLSLDGVSRLEPLDGVVQAIVAATLVRTPVRDVATSPRGTAEFLLARHLPSLVDLMVRRTVAARLDAGDFDEAPLAAGLVARRRARRSRQSATTRRRIVQA